LRTALFCLLRGTLIWVALCLMGCGVPRRGDSNPNPIEAEPVSHMVPDGGGVQFPGKDNGTITPSGLLSSIPYAEEWVRTSLGNLYERYTEKCWGPFRFHDGMNVERDWVSPHDIAISVGPVAPMIENGKTGLCGKTLMKAPEIQGGVELTHA